MNSLRGLFRLIAGIGLAYVLLAGILTYQSFLRWRNSEKIAAHSRDFGKGVMELVMLAQENFAGTRTRDQWQHTLARMYDDLNHFPESDNITLAKVRQLLGWSDEIFALLCQAESSHIQEIYGLSLSAVVLNLDSVVRIMHVQKAILGRQAAMEQAIQVATMLGLSLIVMIVGMGFFIRYFVLKPVQAMGNDIRAYGEGRNEMRTAMTHIAEFDLMAKTFNRTADQIDVAMASLKAEVAERKRAEETVRAHETQLAASLKEKEAMLCEIAAAETERQKMEVQIRQTEKMEATFRMAGGVAHQYNNMIAAVMGNLELAMADRPQGAEVELVEALAAARRAADMGGLLLTFLGQQVGARETLDLSDLCRRGLSDFKDTMPAHINLEVSLPSPGPVIHADARQILKAFHHLLTNACEAIGEAEGTVSASVYIATDMPAAHYFPVTFQAEQAHYAVLEVKDTGCGIEETELEKIFDPFYSTKFTGRGLSLPVTLGIAIAHHGCVWVASEPGRGSTFQVYLPQKG